VETPTELALMIRFALDELSRENGHHVFEHLCRELAQARIASNILPATGPVSAGGDQGRDFETFRTYLAGSLRFSRGFLGLASADTLVFACTLQREDLKLKIKDDVTSICTRGMPVQAIYFLCTEPVTISTRHDLQGWASATHGVALEVLDGVGIARLLADHEVFWIARTYLHLPAELAPAPPGGPEMPRWYAHLREEWADGSRAVRNFAEMMQVVQGLQHATDTRDARADLSDWLRLMEAFIADVADTGTVQCARYEVARATLRGTGDLRPAEHHVRAFFADTRSLTEPADLHDAGVLLHYLETASRNGESSLSTGELTGWTADLRGYITCLLEDTTSPGRRAGLLRAAADLSLRVDIAALERLAGGPAIPAGKHQHMAPDDLPDIEFPAGMPLADIDHAMTTLLELTSLLPQAPLFPVGSLARYFDMVTPALVDHPLYPSVRSGLDEATSRQAGEASTASRCRNRAMALYRNGKRLAALRELHEAKVNWWHGDTVRHSILAMLHIAHIYSELKLPQAAKKYALAAGYGALHAHDQRLRDLAPPAVFDAARYEYQSGAWLTALAMTRVAILLQANYAADPWNLDRHEILGTTILHAAVVKAASRCRTALTEPVSQLITAAALTEEVDEALAIDHGFLEWDEAAFRSHGEDELAGVPFGDAAPVRVFSFSVLGQQWRVQCQNQPAVVTATEEFCAAAQIVLAELTAGDPVLLNSVVEVEVELADATAQPADPVQALPGNTCARWKARLPAEPGQASHDPDLDLLVALLVIVHRSSLLPWDKFTTAVDTAGRLGLMNKLAAAAGYRATITYFTGSEPAPAGRIRAAPLGNPSAFPVREAAELAAPATAGPGYNRDKALEAIRLRYENCAAITRYTLPRAIADPGIRAMFRRLLDEGRPEWIILMTLADIVANHRIRLTPGLAAAASPERWQAIAAEEMRREEQDSDTSPPMTEIAAAFPAQLHLVTAVIARFWGLEINQDTPDFGALETVLKTRYRYWDDDIEHASYFPQLHEDDASPARC
jgi:hypothetical protein